jgi:hypothetical protein
MGEGRGGSGEVRTGLGGETDLKETDQLEDLDVAGRII